MEGLSFCAVSFADLRSIAAQATLMESKLAERSAAPPLVPIRLARADKVLSIANGRACSRNCGDDANRGVGVRFRVSGGRRRRAAAATRGVSPGAP